MRAAALAGENLAAGQRGHFEYRLEPEGRSLIGFFLRRRSPRFALFVSL